MPSDNKQDRYVRIESLPVYAEEVAGNLRVTGKINSKMIAKEILSDIRDIKDVHTSVAERAAENTKIPQDMEWLLDNWYIAEREGKEAVRSLRYAGTVRRVEQGSAMVSILAASLVKSGHGEVTTERLRLFLDSFQKERVLSEREIAVAIPIIKGALISELRDVCISGLGLEDTGEKSIAIGNIFTSLRLLSNIEIADILEDISYTEKVLRQDPAGIYEHMEEATRQSYRREVAILAKQYSLQDFEVAQRIVKLAESNEGKRRHVGYYIFEMPLGEKRKKREGGLYITLIVLGSLIISFLAEFALGRPLISILLIFPVSEIVKNVVDYFALKLHRPVHVPRMKLADGVPHEGRTICVISALLSDGESGAQCANNLEKYYLANRDCGKNLIFGILADFPESKERDVPQTEDWLNMARAEIEGLNKKYGGSFVLLSRPRRFNERDGRYMGWERKRGALLELTRLLRGVESGLECQAGNLLMLEGIKYVITLDSDTRLNVGSAKELIGAMLHPLNSPEISGGVVKEGIGLIQPRICIELEAADKTDFTRIFAGQGGIDPYGSAASDVYQDLFGEGSFTGKGIMDVDAYAKCLDGAFPENTVLSHDLLEGAYLHASYMGEVELADGFPKNTLSHYKRLHRWTRGDWQSSPWLFGRVKNAKGEKIKNPVNQINRWKVLDNLRRSLVPVFTLLGVLAGMLIGGMSFLWAGLIAIASPLSNLLINSAEQVFRRSSHSKLRYHSTIISGFVGGFMETMSLLIFLPYHGYICLSGVLTALYRMLISRKNMLSWVSASETEKKTGASIGHYLKTMFPAIFVGIVVIVFAKYAAAIAVGIVWVLSPLYARSISRERSEERKISEESKNYLTRCAGDIWRYFEDFLMPEDHFLPPDNWQEQPAAGIAHRTSPTNIGLAMLSSLSAIDLNLCPKEKALGYIENIIAAAERVEKWNGHLYNWYDTKTLRPLHPVYVSAVDSGNYAGCLIVLREALYELGENVLAARTDALLRPMDFGVLFDSKRKLFYIGWDIGRGAPTEGWYDLMASEARQTSYIAIAKGDVPAKHWRKLGRALVAQDNFSGMASWTGTMFEYMMPNLIMPCYKNSLIYESLKFCVYVQKKHHKPWGISESAFYAFDPDLNYSYKAHGVQRLALKRGLNRELVVSPYSTFLALPLDCPGAVNNLRKMEAMGATGRYGFYEALDFTPSRQNGGEFETVKTYMAHHIAMSLLSINNTLNGDIMQKRFLRDRSMAAYTELLQEKVPVGQMILRQSHREVPDKPIRLGGSGFARSLGGVDVLEPASTVLSNGAYSVAVTESGMTRSMSSGIMLTRFEPRQTGESMGMGFYLKTQSETYSLQAAPDYSSESRYSSEFTGWEARLFAKRPDIESTVSILVPSDELGEMRRVTLTNTGETSVPCDLVCYFEPVLERPVDYFAHPAFSKLGIETSFSDGAIVVKRRGNGEKPERFMAFACSEAMEYDTSREATVKRQDIYGAINKPAEMTLGTVLDPCVMVRVHLSLRPHESHQVFFALAVGEKERDAIHSVKRILSAGQPTGISYLDSCAGVLSMRSSDIYFATDLITDLIFLTGYRKDCAASIRECKTGQSGLWSFGISGDLPIVAVSVTSEVDMDEAVRCIKAKILLHRCGIVFDLALIVYDSGDYHQPVRTGLGDAISEMGMDSFIGARGGVHLVRGDTDVSPILAAARRIIGPAEKEGRKRNTDLPSISSYKPRSCGSGRLTHYYDSDRSFVFVCKDAMPENCWSHMLTNETYGYVATDSGTGHMWCKNARENKITPWKNDSLTTQGSERLWLLRDGERISLFADMDGYETKVTFGFGFATWEKDIDGTKIKTTAFVPMDLEARVFIIHGDFKPEDKIGYFAELVMGSDEKNSPYVVTEYDSGVFKAVNNSNTEFPDESFSLVTSETEAGFTCDKREHIMGREMGTTGAGLDPCLSITWYAGRGLVIVAGCDEPEKLKRLVSYEAAAQSLEDTKDYWHSITDAITIDTPDEKLNSFVNGWAIYQTLACRIMGRTSVYQSGGAYGFRDQLQDSSALIPRQPEFTRRQIIKAAEHQYIEGDVQHWWHPSGRSDTPDKGVRTRCSDDLLWLPYVLCEYINVTGDKGILEESVSYISSPELDCGEHDRYELAERSDKAESIYLHAVRAVDMVLRRGAGEHGLALVGDGDWNDGMNLVGTAGKGESVWLTWFLCHVLERFSALCEDFGDEDRRYIYESEAKRYADAADRAWDGQWYLRGYYDSGDTLGSSHDEECRIDSIAQSFSTMTEKSDRSKSETALKSAVENLHDRENKIVKLFTPAFEKGEKNPGYIRGYAPGLRENGGQYTHGAIWLAMGCLNMDMTDEGYAILSDLLPGNHEESIYRAEPYVIAADVYSNPQHIGRGGWSWYTGAAGWYLRVVTENLLGLRIKDGMLYIEPKLPHSWNGYSVKFSSDLLSCDIEVRNREKCEVFVNGSLWDGKGLQIGDKKKIGSS